MEGTFHERFFRVFLNLKRNNGDIKAQSFNKMTNKMAKSSIKMKNPQLNLKRERNKFINKFIDFKLYIDISKCIYTLKIDILVLKYMHLF